MNTKQRLEKYDELLQNRAYDPNKEPPPDQIIIRIEGKNIGSAQNFITITGMPKNGKGKFVSAIAAGAISRQEVFGISTRLQPEKKRIALFDTEQSDYDFFKSMETIRKLAGVTSIPSHFDAFNVREDEPSDIVAMIDRYLCLNPDCGLLLIDGILDLLHSYNDEGESKRLINIVKKWTKIHYLLAPIVLHKGKSNSTTVGHLGAMADRASQSILVVEKIKERGTFQLRPDFLRSAEDFTPIEIYYNQHEHGWQQTTYIPPEDDGGKVRKINLRPPELDITIHQDNVRRIFNSELLQSYDMLVQNIREVYAAGRQWAKECIPHLQKIDLLYKTDLGYTNQRKARLFVNV